MNEYLEANREIWNARAQFNVGSKLYDVEGFKAGGETLDPIELTGPGNVRGKSLLHLQCHFGMDTMSWARRGATVTGVDFSEEAIQAARALADETGIAATFIQSDLYELPQNLKGQFDIVFTSHGVLGWLPDIEGWARVVAHFLKPGGIFYIVEVHPFLLMFDERRDDQEIRLRYPYFHRSAPLALEEQGAYADAPGEGVSYSWIHSLSDIFGSLVRSGLSLESFDEYPFMGWAYFPWMTRREDGSWELPGDNGVPLMFSLKATLKTTRDTG